MKKSIFAVCLALVLTIGLTSAAYQAGDTIADFTLNDSDGNPVTLYDYTGKVIFINFWGNT